MDNIILPKLKPVDPPILELCPLIYRFGSWEETTLAPVGESLIDGPFTILSMNLMKEDKFSEQRMKGLIAIISKHRPHFLAFQENLSHLEKWFRSDPFLQTNYLLSPFKGQGAGFKCSLWSHNSMPPTRLTKVIRHSLDIDDDSRRSMQDTTGSQSFLYSIHAEENWQLQVSILLVVQIQDNENKKLRRFIRNCWKELKLV